MQASLLLCKSETSKMRPQPKVIRVLQPEVVPRSCICAHMVAPPSPPAHTVRQQAEARRQRQSGRSLAERAKDLEDAHARAVAKMRRITVLQGPRPTKKAPQSPKMARQVGSFLSARRASRLWVSKARVSRVQGQADWKVWSVRAKVQASNTPTQRTPAPLSTHHTQVEREQRIRKALEMNPMQRAVVSKAGDSEARARERAWIKADEDATIHVSSKHRANAVRAARLYAATKQRVALAGAQLLAAVGSSTDGEGVSDAAYASLVGTAAGTAGVSAGSTIGVNLDRHDTSVAGVKATRPGTGPGPGPGSRSGGTLAASGGKAHVVPNAFADARTGGRELRKATAKPVVTARGMLMSESVVPGTGLNSVERNLLANSDEEERAALVAFIQRRQQTIKSSLSRRLSSVRRASLTPLLAASASSEAAKAAAAGRKVEWRHLKVPDLDPAIQTRVFDQYTAALFSTMEEFSAIED